MESDVKLPDKKNRTNLEARFGQSDAEPQQKLEKNVIVTELSEEAQQKLKVVQTLIEPCDRIAYGQKLREASETLGCSIRSVQ